MAAVGAQPTAASPAGGYPPGSVNPKTGKQVLGAGYAPRTVAHTLSVVHGFYAFHGHFGLGPVVNPVPESRSRRRALAHALPLELPRPHRRARLRPRIQPRQPRAIPDAQWDELFAQMRCARDRALLACYVSSGTRASELLGLRLADIDWQGGKLWVVSKGTRLREPVPASPKAFAYLAAYLDETVRREAPGDRVGVKGLHRWAVAAARLKLRAA